MTTNKQPLTKAQREEAKKNAREAALAKKAERVSELDTPGAEKAGGQGATANPAEGASGFSAEGGAVGEFTNTGLEGTGDGGDPDESFEDDVDHEVVTRVEFEALKRELAEAKLDIASLLSKHESFFNTTNQLSVFIERMKKDVLDVKRGLQRGQGQSAAKAPGTLHGSIDDVGKI